MFVKYSTESLVPLSLWVIKQRIYLKKCFLYTEDWLRTNRGGAELRALGAITKPRHVDWKKSPHFVCPAQVKNVLFFLLCQVLRAPLPNTTHRDSDQMQDLSWQRTCAQSSKSGTYQCLPGNQPRREADVFRRITRCECNVFNCRWRNRQISPWANILFFNDYYPGGQLARKVVLPPAAEPQSDAPPVVSSVTTGVAH